MATDNCVKLCALVRAALIVTVTALAGSQTASPQAPPPTHTPPKWTRSAAIYEINVRQYTPQGTISALIPHIPRLRRLGIDVVWVMPIQPIGVARRKGVLGSPYSVSSYTEVNPAFGTKADFKAFVDAAHRQGLRVVLDWVPNHTAFDHPWITQHPDWYVHRADGSIMNARDNENHETDWTDVAELNYDNPAMRRAMIADMRYWLDAMNVDGFRCDVAGGVPTNFWIEAHSEVPRGKRDLFWLAEAEDPALYVAFDMTYGWEFHHLLNELAQGKRPTSDIDADLVKQAATYPATAFRMYFTSNHDENSWNGTEFERMGENHQAAFVLSATMSESMPLLYTGQEASLHKRLRFFEKDTVDWNGPSLASFYSTTIALKHRNGALWNGAWGGVQSHLATDGGDRVYAFSRTRGKNTVVVMVNFGDSPRTVSYTAFGAPGSYTDWYAHTQATRGRDGKVDVPAHGYRVLVR